jgi:hypothetical protein
MPEVVQKTKDVKRLSKVFESIKFAYGHMAVNKSNESAIY